MLECCSLPVASAKRTHQTEAPPRTRRNATNTFGPEIVRAECTARVAATHNRFRSSNNETAVSKSGECSHHLRFLFQKRTREVRGRGGRRLHSSGSSARPPFPSQSFFLPRSRRKTAASAAMQRFRTGQRQSLQFQSYPISHCGADLPRPLSLGSHAGALPLVSKTGTVQKSLLTSSSVPRPVGSFSFTYSVTKLRN